MKALYFRSLSFEPGRGAPRFFLSLVVSLLVLVGCAQQFSPSFDQALVDGLNQTNEKTLVLFSSVAGGASKASFPRYAAQYDEIIGGFDALKLQSQSRETPRLGQDVVTRLNLPNCEVSTECVNPTPGNLEKAIEVVRDMKALHESSGLSPKRVSLFKNDYEFYFTNVLKFEIYLKRN